MKSFEQLKPEYAGLWASARVRPEHKSEVMATARRIIVNRGRYGAVQKFCGVPWFVIGIIHSLECSLDFNTHLHNGDPLSRKTRNVPANRPDSDKWTWESSAIDALTMKGKEFDKIKDWSVERICWVLETFNGYGYRAKGVPSAYLWSMTNHYSSGKYVADHVWSSTAVSSQCGGLALLKALIEIDPAAIDLHGTEETASVPNWGVAEPPPVTPKSIVKTARKSVSIRLIFSLLMAKVAAFFDSVFHILPEVTNDVSEHVGAIETIGGILKVNIPEIIGAASVAILLVVLYRHLFDKHELVTLKGDGNEKAS